VTPGLKYTLARFGIFVACTVPAIMLLPQSLDLLLRILIGAVLSAVVSLLVLNKWRNQMADQISTGLQQRRDEKERLRAALAGEDETDNETSEPSV
jgi:hypothetical protein